MLPIITNSLMTFAAGFAGAALTKAKGPGQALDDIMYLVGFDRLHTSAEKKRAENEQSITDYKNSIAVKIADIPEKNLQDPPLSIVGPALEASKYYIQEKDLREMFSNVIAKSMDATTSNKVHVSFVDIIRQLSPHDAVILSKLNEYNIAAGSPLPAVELFNKPTPTIKFVMYPIVVLFEDERDIEKNAVTFNNLERLGLIKYHTNTKTAMDNDYDIYNQDPNISNLMQQNGISIRETSYELTNFGVNFLKVCINQ